MAEVKVYQAIARVQAAIAKEGIEKRRKNSQQGYMFRGIDDFYNALAPFLAQEQLCILPRMLSRNCVERETKSGSALFYVTLEAEFDFVSAEDGSKHTVKTYGEAMDSADKATNKAMSAAYKYAAMMAFAIPTEGDNDSENITHEVAGAYDATAWFDAIESAADKSELERLAQELRGTQGIPANVLRNIRSAWASKAKAVQA